MVGTRAFEPRTHGHRGNGRDLSTRESWPSRLRRSAVRTSQHHHTGDACPVIALGRNQQDHRQAEKKTRQRRGRGREEGKRGRRAPQDQFAVLDLYDYLYQYF